MPQTLLDHRFDTLVSRYHDLQFRRHPSWATVMGLHLQDDRLEDYSLAAARGEAEELTAFRADLAAVDPAQLSPALAADRTWLLAVIDGQLQRHEVFRPLENDPDTYSSGISSSAFGLINRDFAPADRRARSLLARMRLMPGVLKEARRNLKHPPKVATEIALDQMDGNADIFRDTIPQAFAEVKDADLRASVDEACREVLGALDDYASFLERELLPRSTGEYAIGEAEYLKKLYYDELIDLPLARLLEVGEADLARNQQAMREACAAIDAEATPREVIARLGERHLAPGEMLSTTQGMLSEIVDFLKDRDMLTMPAGTPLHVVETPPFMRATTTAAMDTPGPFEAPGLNAYYYMTLPNPHWPKDEQEAYMAQWNTPQIANLSVHEAYPGHFVQFLLTEQFPTETRKLLWCPSNAEGWAHYCEQMMVEEGFHAHDPYYRVAQLIDALLRNARVLAGIKLHTGAMSVTEAADFFEREAYLSRPGAKAEAWRGTMDPTYGYYTLGKLMVLKLREDAQKAWGSGFSLKRFHDEFLALGPIPLPLVRQAMLGSVGALL